MSNHQLLNRKKLRRSCQTLIEQEVERARSGEEFNVLVGCTKKVARRFFEDAGLINEATPDVEAIEIMLNTPLFGADWLWFGDRALGSNRYQDHTTVIVLGRNEIPVEELERQGRCLFGDREDETPLQFVEPDDAGRLLLPEEPVPFEMRDGSGIAVNVRLHPDPRIREIQMQHRELNTRQLVERLRLARAPHKKRVVLVCNIPIPGLPVDELVKFNQLLPREDRLLEALREVSRTNHRTLILTGKKAGEHAPDTFRTAEPLFKTSRAYESWLGRAREKPQAVLAALEDGVAGFRVVATQIRRAAPMARKEYCLVLAQDGDDIRALVERDYGPLKGFDEVEITPAILGVKAPLAKVRVGAPRQDHLAALPASDQRRKRFGSGRALTPGQDTAPAEHRDAGEARALAASVARRPKAQDSSSHGRPG